MYHIAICDDDKRFINYIKGIIVKASNSTEKMFKFYEYSSGEELVMNLEGNYRYDLLILDMQMKGLDGDETAKMFRKFFPEAVLVFCSGVCLPSVKSFKATPFRYLLKSYTEKEFICEMKEILAEVEKKSNEPYIIGHYRTNTIKIKVSNVLYIVNAKRGSRIIVSPKCEESRFDEPILVDKKLGQLLEELEGFAFPHNSYIVNLNHVEKIEKNSLVLDNQEVLSISRPYYMSFKQAFIKSMANKY